MRVSDQQIFGLVLANFQRIAQRTLSAQEQVSSGKRVTKPSDDPIGFGRIVSHKTSLARTEQWIRNIDAGVTRLEVADGTLGQVGTVLSRIKELTVRARSDTNTASERQLVAIEVRQLHRELVQFANAEVDGQHLFAGTKTDVAPFALVSGDDVQYLGNDEAQTIAVGKNQTIQVTLPGSQVFTGSVTNVFDGIRNLLLALESNNGGGIEAGIDDVDAAISQVADARGQVGAFDNRLESTRTALRESVDLVKTALSQEEDIDLAEAISNLTRQQTALEAAARSANLIFDNSLLKFLKL
jgi:flagellar hook-associated protein 3 FlgL